MRRLSLVFSNSVLVLVLALAGPATAQVTALDAAAQGLRTNPVFVDSTVRVDSIPLDVDRLRAHVRRSDTPIFVAVLPAAAADETGGQPGLIPSTLGQKTGLRGTYAVLVGKTFRAASNVLPTGRAETLATSAFQGNDGVQPVLENFVDRVNQAAAGSGATAEGSNASEEGGDGGGGVGGGGAVLALLAVGGGGLFMWSRGRRRKQKVQDEKNFAADRQMLQAELAVLSDDVLALDPEVTLHPDARADYDAGVTRFKSAQAALEYADDQVDLVRVGRVIEEGRYAMDRARAVVQGRQPPPPPPELTRPGRHDEPAMELDEVGAPRYAGYGGMPFYGGGWFGGGGGLLTGLMLGQMLGGGFGGWGGGYGHGGHHGDDSGGSDEGGDSGGDWGGGDFGGGDFGGGDFGGGDFGGGGDF